MLRRWLPLLAMVAALCAIGRAYGDAPRVVVRLERVDVQPYFAELARVRAFVNIVTLEGSMLDPGKAEELQLVAGGARLKQIPGIGRFVQTAEPLDLVVVVEVHQSFAPALEDLAEPVEKFIAKLPRATTRVALVTYGEVIKAYPFADPAVTAKKWRRVAPDDVPQPPVLVTALQKAVKMHAAPTAGRPPARKLILVISDGNNEDAQDEATKDQFRKISRNANQNGITIHAIGYTLLDHKGPLRNLGEITKKTSGTFRWARSRPDLTGHIDSLTREIRRQMVLTYFVAPGTVDGKALKVQCRSARCGEEPLDSRELKAPPWRCAGASCGPGSACVANACMALSMSGSPGGSRAWIWVVAVLLAGGGTGAYVVRKRRAAKNADEEALVRQAPAQAGGAMGAALGGPPHAPGQGMPQVVLPDFSNMPYLANSAAVQQMQQQLANLPYVGQAMQAAQKPAASVAPPSRGAVLMVLSGPRQGQQLPLRHGFTIGRTAGCDLVIDDGLTSGHHAQFHLDTAGGVTIVDLGSTNGTFVNGVRSMQARLANGMALRIGQTEIRFLQGQG